MTWPDPAAGAGSGHALQHAQQPGSHEAAARTTCGLCRQGCLRLLQTNELASCLTPLPCAGVPAWRTMMTPKHRVQRPQLRASQQRSGRLLRSTPPRQGYKYLQAQVSQWSGSSSHAADIHSSNAEQFASASLPWHPCQLRYNNSTGSLRSASCSSCSYQPVTSRLCFCMSPPAR